MDHFCRIYFALLICLCRDVFGQDPTTVLPTVTITNTSTVTNTSSVQLLTTPSMATSKVDSSTTTGSGNITAVDLSNFTSISTKVTTTLSPTTTSNTPSSSTNVVATSLQSDTAGPPLTSTQTITYSTPQEYPTPTVINPTTLISTVPPSTLTVSTMIPSSKTVSDTTAESPTLVQIILSTAPRTATEIQTNNPTTLSSTVIPNTATDPTAISSSTTVSSTTVGLSTSVQMNPGTSTLLTTTALPTTTATSTIITTQPTTTTQSSTVSSTTTTLYSTPTLQTLTVTVSFLNDTWLPDYLNSASDVYKTYVKDKQAYLLRILSLSGVYSVAIFNLRQGSVVVDAQLNSPTPLNGPAIVAFMNSIQGVSASLPPSMTTPVPSLTSLPGWAIAVIVVCSILIVAAIAFTVASVLIRKNRLRGYGRHQVEFFEMENGWTYNKRESNYANNRGFQGEN